VTPDALARQARRADNAGCSRRPRLDTVEGCPLDRAATKEPT